MKLPKVKVTFNRHFYIFVACAVIVFALGALSNKAWNTEVAKDQRTAFNAKLASDATKAYRAHVVDKEKAKLKAECDKEVAYYNALTPTQKTKQTPPACQNLQYVE